MDDETYSQTWRDILAPYGVAPDAFQARYDEDLQDYDIVISSGPLSEDQVETIWHWLRQRGVVSFTDPANAETWQRLDDRMNNVSARARAQTLRQETPGLPVFDPGKGDLATFVNEVERYCGYAPGSAAEVTGSIILLRPVIGAAFMRFSEILSAGVADVEAVRVVMRGEMAPG